MGLTEVCPSCGAGVAAEDRFCEGCGARQPADGDRIERDLGPVAGVTDLGLRHPRNEDALAIQLAGDAVIAVVCDGVSTSERADQAAQLAVRVAAELLATALPAGIDPAAATVDAISAAGKAVTGLATGQITDDADSAPACTCVCAVVTRDAVTVGWLGDSRAYWLAGDGSSALLTTDDSWATDMVTSGALTPQEAAADPRAHALTGWLGADAEPDQARPHLATFTPTGPGVLLLCSDGLWNYCPDQHELAAMVIPAASTAPLAGTPLAAAKTLVQYALRCGGGDNVTAVLAPFPPALPRRSTT